MNCHAPWPQAVHGTLYKTETSFERAEMLKCTGGPHKVEVHQIIGNRVHINHAKSHEPVKGVRGTQPVRIEISQIFKVLSARYPSGHFRCCSLLIGSDNCAA